jgi:uncharacterized protein
MNDDIAISGPSEQEREEAPCDIAVPATVDCWRCGKTIMSQMPRCPYCAALPRGQTTPAKARLSVVDHDLRAIFRSLAVFAVFLAVTFIAGWSSHGEEDSTGNLPTRSSNVVLHRLIVFDAIDTVLILAAWAWIGQPRREARRSFARRCCVWALFLPVLAAALTLNWAYHAVLNQWVGVVPWDCIVADDRSNLVGWIITICIQPALIEELYCRHLAFGSLRPVMGGHTVVWVTAAMFTLLHIGVLLSMPVLFLLGLVLGYARLATGNVALPMVLHFLHNAAVMAYNLRSS